MNNLDQVLINMDFDFLSQGKQALKIEALPKALQDEHNFFLDVRSSEEMKFLSFPFAKHIPLNEIPHRLNEIPKDKCIVTFCAAIFRGSVVYTYLSANGFKEVKCLTASSADIASALKPGMVAKILK